MTGFLLKNVTSLRWALDHHNRTCGDVALAFRLNPVDHGLLDFDELWGVPVLADERVAVKDIRVSCLSNEHETQEALDDFANRVCSVAAT